MRVLICGGRDYNDWRSFRNELEKIAIIRFPKTEPDEYGNYLYDVTIISGAARGTDTLAIDWAVVNWTGLQTYPADWKTHGKAAGPIRNQQMIDEGKPDLVIAFPGGSGTKDMIRRAKKAGIDMKEIEIEVFDNVNDAMWWLDDRLHSLMDKDEYDIKGEITLVNYQWRVSVMTNTAQGELDL